MSDELKFFGWERSGVYALATGGALLDGRMPAHLPVTIADRDIPLSAMTQNAEFLIAGPRDVTGLRKTAIGKRYPTPGNTTAETTKLAYVEMNAPDLPWRYTPMAAVGNALRPWIVLVVGTEDEISLGTGGTIACADAVAAAHPLGQSARWAHIQEVDGKSIARLLSPRALLANTSYIAAIVPAFTEAGAPRWTSAGFTAPAYDLWRFHTGENGDFESLAGALQPGVADPTTGRATLQYPRLPAAPELSIRGAIAPLFGIDAPLPASIADDMSTLGTALTDSRNRPIVGLPVYGSEWVADPASTKWGATFGVDPRHRGVAGLGMKAGVDLQDALMDAATTQAGALGEAAQRIRHLTCGLMAVRSLWTRRLPSDPMQRLQLYGPSMRRMLTFNGPVLDQIAGGPRPLPGNLFASAARRVLRRGPARTRRAAPDAGLPALVLAAANVCPPPPERVPWGLIHTDDLASTLGLLRLEDVLREFDGTGRPQDGGGEQEPDEGARILLEEIDRPTKMPPCQPVDLEKVEEVLTAAIDPTVDMPVVAKRVVDTIGGLGADPLKPIEVCVGLDFPLWTYVRDHAADWLLPGMNELPDNAVVAFESNPAFVDAFLVGLNTQVISELRWRNIPLSPGCTPVRMFWGPIDANGTRQPDIHGIKTWVDGSDLGDVSHGVGASAGSDVILVLRTDLFRRYPKTLVYLVPAPTANSQPDWSADPSFAARVLPGFQGQVADDIVFFRFDLSPAIARQHWVVLEEPPIGVTFRSDTAVGPGVTDGASFAIATIDQTTRVLIAGPTLIPEP